MNKHLSLLTLLFCILFSSLISLVVAQEKSLPDRIDWREGCDSTYVFEITNKEAQKFLKEKGSPKLMEKLLYNHVATFKKYWENGPDQGHFIFAHIDKNKINYSYIPYIPFQVFLFREYGILTLQVVDSKGEVRSDAKVRIQNGKWRLFDSHIPYDKDSKVYRTDDWSEKEERILTVELDKFTAVFDLTKHVIRPTYGSDYGDDRDSGPDFYSYMITDKNKYKPNEKVRFKSYALTGGKKTIKKSLELWLQESNSYYKFKKIADIEPYNPGGFAGEMELHDSLKLVLDKSYAMQLRDKKGRIVSRTSFMYEDYELYDNKIETKITDYTHYSPNENELEIKVVDANNLIMPDMKANIRITLNKIRHSYVDLLVVPSVIKADTIMLDNDKPTTYKIPASLFDNTDCDYRISVSVITPDGQLLKSEYNVVFYKSHYRVIDTTQDSTLVFSFKELGIEKSVPAKLSINGKDEKDIVLPYTTDFDQKIDYYRINIPEYDLKKIVHVSSVDPELDVKGGFIKDSLVMELVNPLNLDVAWYIYEGNTLIEKGSGKEIDFRVEYPNLDVVYFLEAFFVMGDEDHVYRRMFIPKEEFLNIDWDMPTRIYPGQTVDSKIKITDSRGRAVKGVDITAFANNSLLNYHVPELPYYGNTPKGREKRDSYEIEEKYVIYSEPLTQENYQYWNKIAHLDQNPYYRFIFPNPPLNRGKGIEVDYTVEGLPYHDVYKYTIDTPDGTTEFAPYVMQDGNAVDIYAIEVDGIPVYFNWTDQPKGYSFLVDRENYHKITIRLQDRIIIIDKYCFDEGKKTILSLNLNNFPESKHIREIKINPINRGTKKHPRWSYELDRREIDVYSKYISSMPIDESDRFIYMTHSIDSMDIVVPVFHPFLKKREDYYQPQKAHQLIGPIGEGRFRFMDGVKYRHEGGFKYQFEDNVVYKYPEQVCPSSLVWKTSNDYRNLNDFNFTPTEFKRQIGLIPTEGAKWFPEVVTFDRLTIHLPKDKDESGLRGIIMRNRDTGKFFVPIFNQNYLSVHRKGNGPFGLKGMDYGDYDVFALYANGNYLRYSKVPMQPSTSVYLKMNECIEQPKDSVSTEWLKYTPPVQATAQIGNRPGIVSREYKDIGKKYFNPANDVRGVVIEENGEPLIGVSISIKDSKAGTMTDVDGQFILDLHGAENTLVFSYVGFETQEISVTRGSSITVTLEPSAMMLEETVVVGYSIQRKSALTGSMSGISIRGAASVGEPEKLVEFNEEDEVEEEDGSAQLYEELMQLNGMRSNFSDVAFWEPELVTDKKGEVDFSVTFPDNITKWQSIVYAMNRKLKTGTLYRNINSYKPLMAELKMPQFLVEGDSTLLATNIRNYTKDKTINGVIEFINNGKRDFTTPISFESSFQNYLPIIAPLETDSVKYSYRFTRDDGYSDGEERSIQIEKQGAEVAEGTLQFLRNGDNIDVVAQNDETVNISISGKQIDVYMDATRDLMNYKYACNEQLASKLIGLLNFRLYKQFKKEPFKHDKNINEIVNRLLKNQNSDKLWSWWGNGRSTSFWMSAHILRALNMARQAGYKVDFNIEKVQYDYIDIHRFRDTSLRDIDVLNALIDWGTDQSYDEIIPLFEEKIAEIEAKEDSLVNRYNRTKKPKDYFRRNSYLTEKLTLLEMRQKLGMDYDRSLLTNHLNKDVLGTINIKDTIAPRYWYYDNDAANIVAYRIMRNDSVLNQYVDGMQMSILGTKRYGWNTYRASSALMTILPDLLSESASADSQAKVVLSGKDNQTIKEFPYNTTLQRGERLSITKESGIPLFYSAYTIKRRKEQHFGEAFDVKTAISQPRLQKGMSAWINVEVVVKQDNAEHVMIEVPIPAGCSYKDKRQSYSGYEVYREYFKEKAVIFCEKLPKGKYTYTIELLPRYSGEYTLNPAKVEMMYFPVINSNNDLRKVSIE